MNSTTKTICAAGAALLAISATPVWAQDSDRPNGISIYGGVSYERTSGFLLDTIDSSSGLANLTTGADRPHNMLGGEISIAAPLNDWLSLTASGSYHKSSSGNNTLPGGVFRSISASTILVIPDQTGLRLQQSSLTVVGGGEFRIPNLRSRLSPFLRVQAGIVRASAGDDNIPQQRANLIGGNHFSNTSFTVNIGAGLDLPVSRNIDLRLIQVDYRYIAPVSRRLTSEGDRVDSLVTGFTGGSVVTSLQNYDARVDRRNDIVVSAGLVFRL